ncbi:MAG: YncE family protein [Phenylobacterium sp.]
MRSMPFLAVLAAGLAIAGLPASARAAACAYTAGAARVAVPGSPVGVKPTADGCWLFVSLIAGPQGPGVAVLRNEGGAFRLARFVSTPGQPGGLSLSHDGRLLAAAAQDRTLLLDVAKLETDAAAALVGEAPQGPGTGAIYAQFALDDRTLFVSEESREHLAVVDVARALSGAGSAAILGRVPQAHGPVGLALSADGRRLYATSEIATAQMGFPRRCTPPRPGSAPGAPEGVLFVVDVATAVKDPEHSVAAAWAAGCSPVRVALSPDGATAWVTARSDDALLAFKTADLKGVQPAPSPERRKVGRAPVGVLSQPDGGAVWVANSDRFSSTGEGSLTATPVAAGEARTVASGKFPRELAFLPSGRTLVATVFGSGELQFVTVQGP